MPESLQGAWIVVGACGTCAKRSNEEYENSVLQSDLVRTMRAFLALRRKKGKKKPPITMPPMFRHGTASQQIIAKSDYLETPLDGFYPRLFIMMVFEPATMLLPPEAAETVSERALRLWFRRAERSDSEIVVSDPAVVKNAYLSTADFLVNCDVTFEGRSVSVRQNFPIRKFMRMLAKIAYCFAVAELGIERFECSSIRKLVCGERDDYHNFVGGVVVEGDRLTSRYLHHLAFRQRGTCLTVLVHLFASYDAPAYEVVVDECDPSYADG